jgi:hypothetical protein
MEDIRWDDPTNFPLSNGPLRLTTPSTALTFTLAQDGQLIEFVLPFPMHLVDPKEWKALNSTVGGRPVSIQKPIPSIQQYVPINRLGTESPDAFCTLIRVVCQYDANVASYPKPADVWPLVDLLLNWVRIKARHYWLLHGHAGFGALYRCSILTQEQQAFGNRTTVSYGRNVIVRPLDEALWLSIQSELISGLSIPASESIFCDALISIVAGDELKGVLELGVAAEIEITQLLISASRTPPSSRKKAEFHSKSGDWDSFKKKLQDWPQDLGLQAAASFGAPGVFKDWVKVVKELYLLRNGVAHGGKLIPGGALRDINEYVFATHALFAYCRDQRARTGIIDYTYPTPRRPYDQLLGLITGTFVAEGGYGLHLSKNN